MPAQWTGGWFEFLQRLLHGEHDPDYSTPGPSELDMCATRMVHFSSVLTALSITSVLVVPESLGFL